MIDDPSQAELVARAQAGDDQAFTELIRPYYGKICIYLARLISHDDRWRDLAVAYLLFHCNLKPREIVRRCPEEFSDVQEIYHRRRNITERLLRDSDQIRWKIDGTE